MTVFVRRSNPHEMQKTAPDSMASRQFGQPCWAPCSGSLSGLSVYSSFSLSSEEMGVFTEALHYGHIECGTLIQKRPSMLSVIWDSFSITGGEPKGPSSINDSDFILTAFPSLPSMGVCPHKLDEMSSRFCAVSEGNWARDKQLRMGITPAMGSKQVPRIATETTLRYFQTTPCQAEIELFFAGNAALAD